MKLMAEDLSDWQYLVKRECGPYLMCLFVNVRESVGAATVRHKESFKVV